MVKIAREAFPEVQWSPWEFKTLPKGYWRDPKNLRPYLVWLGAKLNHRTPEDWYQIQTADFNSNFGSVVLSTHGGSPFKVLSVAFPEYGLKPWLFNAFPKGLFHSESLRNDYLTWLMQKVGVRTVSQLKKSHFLDNGGKPLLEYYFNSGSDSLKTFISDENDNYAEEIRSNKKIMSMKSSWVCFSYDISRPSA
jgi:hypothetical protein